MADNKQYRGQTLVVDGSRSGADVFQTKFAYNSLHNIEYTGEAKFGVLEDNSKWYIEKLEYDIVGNIANCLTATNQIYAGAVDIVIDASGDPNIIVTMTGLAPALLDILNVNDIINLTTPGNANLIQGIITNLVKSTGVFTVNIGSSGVIDETSVTIGVSDCIFTLNNDEAKPFNKRVWSLRSQYLYK